LATPKGIWIIGTDTDAGKTVVTAGLLRLLPGARAIKVVQTGGGPLDQTVYSQAAPGANSATVHQFKHPSSPHLAAELEAVKLDVPELAASISRLASGEGITLLEASGGVCSPLNRGETFVDLLALLDFPALLVVRNVLGAINHALLSAAALRQRGIELAGFVFCETTAAAAPAEILADNRRTIVELGGAPELGNIPFLPELASGQSQAWEAVEKSLAPLARRLTLPSPAPSQTLSRFDQEHLWHPYARVAPAEENWVVSRAEGNYLILQDGRRLLDGMASWWCAIHGYGRREIVAAVENQARRLPHVMFGGLTHAPAVELAQRLLRIAPEGFTQVFFADSGSVAVEVALKMARQYWLGRGKPKKTRFIAPRGGYHGDTLGAMSVCDPVNGMHSLFRGLLPEQLFASRPGPAFRDEFEPSSLENLRLLLERHQDELAALILEPIVQGAGGMWFYHPEYLREAARLCRQAGILLIADEIATGFGRTGRLFAVEWADTLPDIMCVGKALTGGSLSLAAVLARPEVAEGLSAGGGVLMHGPTFMANPLACAAATASIDLLLASPWRERVAALEKRLKTGLSQLASHPAVADVRVLGAIGVVETRRPVEQHRLARFFVEQGVWLRPFGHLLYAMPPFTLGDAEVDRLTQAMADAVNSGLV
jgi:adenosylmethionine-8-amino-7-oxononanoate aminotransferase